MTGTVHHDGVAPELDIRPCPVVVGISDQMKVDRALEAAAAWASRRHTDVLLVMGLDRHHRPEAEQLRRQAAARISAAANEVALRTDVAVRVHTRVVDRPADEALIEQSHTAGVVVMQRRDLGLLSRVRIGSTTSMVAARAHAPVLVVHGSDPEPAGQGVLVAVDTRGHSSRAVAEAFDEASWRRVPLTAVHVWEPPLYGVVPLDDPAIEQSRAEADELVAEQLAGFADRYPDVVVHRQVARGEIVETLAGLSVDHQLLVLGRHAADQPGPRNLGGTVRHLLARAACPVLVTPTGGSGGQVAR